MALLPLAYYNDRWHWPRILKHYSWLRVYTCNAKLSGSTALSTGFPSRQASSYKSSNKLFRVHFGVLLYSAVTTCYTIVKIFFMAHRSRRALNTDPGEDLSKLSSEVLKLRLQALNLPVTGSKGHLLNRLKRATQGNAVAPRRKPQKRLSQPKARRGRSAKRTAIESQPSDEAENVLRWRNVPSSLEHEQEDSALSDDSRQPRPQANSLYASERRRTGTERDSARPGIKWQKGPRSGRKSPR